MTHDEFHNLMNAFLAGGLSDAERTALTAHAATCPACAAALEQAEAADRELDELFAAARPGRGLEDRVIARLRTVKRPPMVLHPLVRRAAVGVAATILLGGVGFAVTQAEEGGGPLLSFLDPAARDGRVKGASNLRQFGQAVRDNRAAQEVYYNDLAGAVETPAAMAHRFAYDLSPSARPAGAPESALGEVDKLGRIAGGAGAAPADGLTTYYARGLNRAQSEAGDKTIDEKSVDARGYSLAFRQSGMAAGQDARHRTENLQRELAAGMQAVPAQNGPAAPTASAGFGMAVEDETRRAKLAIKGPAPGASTPAAPESEALAQLKATKQLGDEVAELEVLTKKEAPAEGAQVPALEYSFSKAMSERTGAEVATGLGMTAEAGKPVAPSVNFGDSEGKPAAATAGGDTAASNGAFRPADWYLQPGTTERFERQLDGSQPTHWGSIPARNETLLGARVAVERGEEREKQEWDEGRHAVLQRDGEGVKDGFAVAGATAVPADEAKTELKARAGAADDKAVDFAPPAAGDTVAAVVESDVKQAGTDSLADATKFTEAPDVTLQAQDADADPAQAIETLNAVALAQAGEANRQGQPGGEGQPGAAGEAEPAAVAPGQQAATPEQVRAKAAEEARIAEQANRADRQIIRNGDMSFEVDGYDSAVVQITKIAAEEGGFIATTESEKLPNGKVKGSVIVRVPPQRLDTLVLKLRGLGDLKNSRISAQDVTKQFTDLQAQLKAATTMEKRLLQIIESGKGEVKDLIEAEKQLGTWRERIETLTGELNYYKNLISLSTLTVSLVERDIRQSALLSESEQVNMGIEAEDVEKARAEAIKAIEEAKGRIVESDLKTHDAGQYAAMITAEVAPDAAGPVIDRLKQIGRVARFDIQRRRETAENAPPAPGARVERKDTRLQLSLYNLANVNPRVSTNLNLAADDVEKAYRAIIEQATSAGGRVVTSNLTKPNLEQTVGTIDVHVPTESADLLLAAARAAGEVMRLESATNSDVQNSTDAKRGFHVEIRSLALVVPRETTTVQVAARDIAVSFNALREAVRSAGGRVFTSQLAEQGAANVTSELAFDVARDDLQTIQTALDAAGVTVSRNVNRSTDAENTVDTKVRFQVTFVDERAVPARETATMNLAVDDVAARYESLVDSLRDAGARVTEARIDQSKPNEATASFNVEVRRAERAAVDKLLDDAGDTFGRTVSRPADGQAYLEDKVRMVVSVVDVDNLAPRERSALGLEVTDVHGTVNAIETTAIALGGRKVDSDWAVNADGSNVARVVVDVPLSKAGELLTAAQRQGRVTTVQREQDPSAPEGSFARARLEVTVGTSDPILQRDQSLWTSIKSGLSTSMYWLLQSVTLIVIGLFLVAPWLLIVWLAWRLVRGYRERRRRRLGLAGGPTAPPPGGPAAASPAV